MSLLAAVLLVSACGPSRAEFSKLKAEHQRLMAEDSVLKAEVAVLKTGPSALLARARMFYCERKMDSANASLNSLAFSYPGSAQAESGKKLLTLLRKALPTGRAAASGGGVGSGSSGSNVYVGDSKSAWEYHRLDCEHLPKNHVSLSRSEAISRGFKPCPECCPKDYAEQSPVEPPAWIKPRQEKPKTKP
jgi:hypothetical protein